MEKKKLNNLENAIMYWLSDGKYWKGKELINYIEDDDYGQGELLGNNCENEYYWENIVEEIEDSGYFYEPQWVNAPMLRMGIQQLRLKGYAIVANLRGYKLVKDKNELQTYISKRGAEIGREWKALKSMCIDNGLSCEQLEFNLEGKND